MDEAKKTKQKMRLKKMEKIQVWGSGWVRIQGEGKGSWEKKWGRYLHDADGKHERPSLVET